MIQCVITLVMEEYMKNQGYWLGKERSKETNDKISKTLTGKYLREQSGNWKGGRIQKNGYIFIRMPNHPRARGGYVQEHILVIEQKIGRPLLKNEETHHINGIKNDNRPENLVALSKKEHRKTQRDYPRYSFENIPEPTKIGEKISIDSGRMIKTHTCSQCKGCGKLFWKNQSCIKGYCERNCR